MKDLLFEQQRTDALAVACIYCDQQPGQECINPNTDEPLEHQPAHSSRIKTAERRQAAADPADSETRAAEAAEQTRLREVRRDHLRARGWFHAHYAGRCGICRRRFAKGALIHVAGKSRFRAECCAETIFRGVVGQLPPEENA